MGIRAIITIGDVSGISEKMTAIFPDGFKKELAMTSKPRIRGIVMGSMNCCVSVSLSDAAPTAAKSDP